MGSKNAPITMEVFEDFQCPACRNFYETTLKQVIDNYVNTGKVYLIHRDFPLEMHPYARSGRAFCQCCRRARPISRSSSELCSTRRINGP